MNQSANKQHRATHTSNERQAYSKQTNRNGCGAPAGLGGAPEVALQTLDVLLHGDGRGPHRVEAREAVRVAERTQVLQDQS